MRYAALLRGINVGGNNKISMAELREAMSDAGYANVQTYLQSGNLFFDAPKKPAATSLSKLVTKRFGLEIPIVVQTKAQILAAINNNPFSDVDFEPKRLHVMYMDKTPTASAIKKLDTDQFGNDKMITIGSHTYVLYEQDSWSSKATIYIPEKAFELTATARNWNTANKLAELIKA